MLFRPLFLAFVLSLCTTLACADQVVLKNGDKISGSITSSDLATITVDTSYAGKVTIKWDSVQSVTSEKPVYVVEKSGKVLKGNLTATDSALTVQTEQGPVEIDKAAAVAVRSEAEQKAYGAWGGSADAGLSLSRGNSETTNVALGVNVARSTAESKTSAFVTTLFAKGKVGGISQTTASAAHGGIRYEHNISPKTYFFVEDDIDHDRFQALDAREVIAGGFGYHAIKTAATTLDLSAGGSYNSEFFTNLHRSQAELLLAEEYTRKLSASLSFNERFELYPNLSDIGQYRFAFDSAAVSKISKAFSLQIELSDRYLSNPVLGLKGNDLLLTTGLHFSFGAAKGL